MKINSFSNNANFGKVFAVAGSKEKIKELKNALTKQGKKMVVMPATDLYVGRCEDGLCTKAANSGKEVAFFVTGKDIEKVRFMESGWGSRNGVSHNISDFIDLNNVTDDTKTMIKTWDV